MRISGQRVGILSICFILIRYFIRYIYKTGLVGEWREEGWHDSNFAVDAIKNKV
jgi:hypothetical protein